MFTSVVEFTVGTIFLCGSAWLLELLSSTRKRLRAEDKGKVNIPETGEQCGQGDVNFELTCSKAHFDQQISALEDAVNVAKTETNEKSRLLNEAQNELTILKAQCNEEKSAVMEADKKILELERELNSCKENINTLTEESRNQKELLLKLTDEKNEVTQSAATSRQQAEALATEQSAALTEALGTLQQAVRHAKEEAPSDLSRPEEKEDPVGINETLEEWFVKHGVLTRVPPKTWIQLLEHSGFLIEEKASHLREKADSLFHDDPKADDNTNNQN
jgi:predicted RNase H-like nuclease (RuvC/YqgF family)